MSAAWEKLESEKSLETAVEASKSSWSLGGSFWRHRFRESENVEPPKKTGSRNGVEFYEASVLERLLDDDFLNLSLLAGSKLL